MKFFENNWRQNTHDDPIISGRAISMIKPISCRFSYILSIFFVKEYFVDNGIIVSLFFVSFFFMGNIYILMITLNNNKNWGVEMSCFVLPIYI